MSDIKGLSSCPKCDYDAIFVPLVPAVGYDGKLYGGKSEGFCNNPQCDQLLWYYPHSGRVTRRTGGITLAEYQARDTDVRIINVIRRNRGLLPVMEMDAELMSGYNDYKEGRVRPWIEVNMELGIRDSLVARLRRVPVEWFWWIVAVLKSPFLGKLPPSSLVDMDALAAPQSRNKTINQVRAAGDGLDPVEVDNAKRYLWLGVTDS